VSIILPSSYVFSLQDLGQRLSSAALGEGQFRSLHHFRHEFLSARRVAVFLFQ
jgi:hypothetical protein